MKVWLDDERPMPEGYDIHVKTAQEAIKLIDTGKVEVISLDNDLGGSGTLEGRHVADHIEKLAFENKIPKIVCRIHTQNPVAAQVMKTTIRNAYRFWMEHDG